MTATQIPPGELESLVALARRAFRFRWASLAVLVLGCAATVAWERTRARTYRSETTLVVREAIAVPGVDAGDPARRLPQRLSQALLARTRLAAIVRDLALYPGKGEGAQTALLREHIVSRANTDSLAISFDGPSPELAQAVAARLATGLVEEMRVAQAEQAARTRAFLEAEITSVELDLRQREVAAAGFLLRHPEFTRGGPLLAGLVPMTVVATRADGPPRDPSPRSPA